MPRAEMVPGTLDVMLLAVLGRGPAHGYALAREIERLSDDVFVVEEGSLYPALRRLAARGDVACEPRETPPGRPPSPGRTAKVYRLTGAGRRRLAQQAALWRAAARGVDRVIDGRPPAPPQARPSRPATNWGGDDFFGADT